MFAFEELSVDIKQIENTDWQLNDVSLSLFDLNKQTQQLSLSIKQLSLPEPLSELKFFDIRCVKFSWQENQIDCQKGKAKHDSKFFHSSP
ncbi:MAG: C4-dicarboxylate ABC transporter, partial [Methyloprofundus sp.]|nr:C4-dicarboxylate ABC transporter [Methyloprofundus sp.]